MSEFENEKDIESTEENVLNLITYPRTTRMNKHTKRHEKNNVWNQRSVLYEKFKKLVSKLARNKQHVNKVYMKNLKTYSHVYSINYINTFTTILITIFIVTPHNLHITITIKVLAVSIQIWSFSKHS